MKWSLRARFTLLVCSLVFATAAATSLLAIRRDLVALEAELRARGASLARNLAGMAADLILAKDALTLAAVTAETKARNPGVLYAVVVDDREKIVAHSDPETHVGKVYTRDRGASRPGPADEQTSVRTGPDGDTLDFAAGISPRGQVLRLGEVHVGLTPASIARARRGALAAAAAAAAATLVLAFVASWLAVALATKPIRTLSHGARLVAKGDRTLRFGLPPGDELGDLSATFDGMLDALAEAERDALGRQKLEQEMSVARQVQQALVPKESPKPDGFEFAHRYRTARQIGGDYLDFFDLPSGRVAMLVADVSGKGVPAALLMTQTRALIRSVAPYAETVSGLLSSANRAIAAEVDEGTYVTAFACVLDPVRTTITFCSAGHPEMMWYSATDREVRWMQSSPENYPLGIDPGPGFDATARDQVLRMAPGDLVLIYTDGLSEAANPEKKRYGSDRIAVIARRHAPAGADAFLDALEHDLAEFTAGASQSDDLAIIALSVHPR